MVSFELAFHRWAKVALALTLVTAQISVPGASANDARTQAPNEQASVEVRLDERDAEVLFYANKHDVTLDRAIEIANWLEAAAPHLTDLPEIAEIYADARLVHGGSSAARDLPAGEIRVEVKVTDPGDPRLRSLIESIESTRFGTFIPSVVVEEVPRSLLELDALATQMLAGMSRESVVVEYNFERGEVTLTPAPPDTGSMWASQCTNVSGGRLDGGRRIRLDNDTLNGCQAERGCTSGFPMRFAGTYGVTTAGHCVDAFGTNYSADSSGFVDYPSDRDTDMFWVYQPDDIVVSAYAYWRDGPANGNLDDDVAFLRRVDASSTYPGQIWKWDTSEWRNIVGYEASSAIYGMTVCVAASPAAANGASTYCGEVIDPITDSTGTDTGSYLRWTEVDFTQGDYNQGMSGGLGSSGGPVFYGGVVYGLFSRVSNCNSDGSGPCTPARYYRIGSMKVAMEAASADVKFICYNAVFCDPN